MLPRSRCPCAYLASRSVLRTLSLVSFVGLITGCCPDDNTEHYTYDDVQLSYSHQDTEQTPIAAGEVFELEVTVPLAARYARRTRCFRRRGLD